MYSSRLSRSSSSICSLVITNSCDRAYILWKTFYYGAYSYLWRWRYWVIEQRILRGVVATCWNRSDKSEIPSLFSLDSPIGWLVVGTFIRMLVYARREWLDLLDAIWYWWLWIPCCSSYCQFSKKQSLLYWGILFVMEVTAIYDVKQSSSARIIEHEFWPLDEIDPKKAKFPCCLVWTPLPVVSWLAPFIGHVGICKEDGVILDFSGSNLINVDDFSYGAVGRYLQLDREQCCFPPNLGRHKCKHSYRHAEYGTAISWDDALLSSARHFEHKSYNLFTCNCHSFVANCLNRVCYGGSMNWNMVNVAALVYTKGQWVDSLSILRSFLPFTVVGCLGIYMVGWPFLLGLLSFSILLIGWFLIGTCCVKDLLDC